MKKFVSAFATVALLIVSLVSCNSNLGLSESASDYGRYSVKIDGQDATVVGAGDSDASTRFQWNGTSGTMILQRVKVDGHVISYTNYWNITMSFSGSTYPKVNEDLADFNPIRDGYTFASGSAKVTLKDFGQDWIEIQFKDFKFTKNEDPTQVSSITGTVRMNYSFE